MQSENVINTIEKYISSMKSSEMPGVLKGYTIEGTAKAVKKYNKLKDKCDSGTLYHFADSNMGVMAYYFYKAKNNKIYVLTFWSPISLILSLGNYWEVDNITNMLSNSSLYCL